MTEPNIERAAALGQELVAVHEWLRGELARLRAEIGNGPRPIDLRAHCLTFCAALTRHHTSEDTIAFPALRQRFPELAPVLAELSRDHDMVANILREVHKLATTATPDTASAVGHELDGLTAILESHFQWEERRLLTAFDQLDAAGDLFGRSES